MSQVCWKIWIYTIEKLRGPKDEKPKKLASRQILIKLLKIKGPGKIENSLREIPHTYKGMPFKLIGLWPENKSQG